MKKIAAVLFTAVAALCLCFGLAACGGSEGHRHFYDMNYWFSDGTYHWHQCTMTDGYECDAKIIDKEKCVDADGDGRCDTCHHTIMVHVLTRVPAKESTCTEPGNVEYYTCSHCDKWFFNSDATLEAIKGLHAAQSGGVYLPTHTYVDGACSVCHTPQPTDGVSYSIEEDENGDLFARVNEIFDPSAADVVIAADHLGVPVTLITDNTAHEDTPVRSVTIPDSVTTIERNAFWGCRALESVTIGNGVTSIEECAFSDCAKLSSVTFGDAVETIGEVAFNGCAMTQIELPGSLKTIGRRAFTSEHLQKVTFGEGMEEVSSGAFEDCTGLTEAIFPQSITAIRQGAFENCGFVELTIPGNIEYLDVAAFQQCAQLQSVVLEDGLERLSVSGEDYSGFGSFNGCENLTSVTFPSTLTFIGNSTFYNTKLNDADLSVCTSLTYIGREAFSETELEAITIPNSVEVMELEAFAWNTKLKTVTLGTGLTDYDAAFRSCTELTDINLPQGLSTISFSAFEGTKIATIEIPSSVTYLGSYAFSDCTELESITIPEGVKKIGADGLLFAGCTKLKTLDWNATCEMDGLSEPFYGRVLGNNSDESPDMTITIGDHVTKICPRLFASAKIASITIPESVTEIGAGAFEYCDSLATINITDNVTSIGENAFYRTAYYKDNSHQDESGVLYVGNHLIVAMRDVRGTYSIRMGTKTIADAAFYQNTGLTSINIPVGVVAIGARAFWTCSALEGTLTTGILSIPYTVETIGEEAFYFCNKLTGISIAEGVKTIGDWAFDACDHLLGITIPNSVTSIGDGAFADCRAMKEVRIGNGVMHLGGSLFRDCEALTDIRFAGTFARWEEIGGTGKVPSEATLHCTDGDYDSQGRQI